MWAPCLGSARERRHSTHVFTEPHRRAAVLPEAQSRRASRGRRHPRGSRNRGITVPEFGRDLQDPHVQPLCPLLTALSATSPQLWNTSGFGDSPTTLRSCATAAPLFGDKILPNIQPEITESNPWLYPGPPKPYVRPSGPRAQGCAPRRPSAAEPFPKLCAKRTPARTWAGNTALLGPHSIPTSHPRMGADGRGDARPTHLGTRRPRPRDGRSCVAPSPGGSSRPGAPRARRTPRYPAARARCRTRTNPGRWRRRRARSPAAGTPPARRGSPSRRRTPYPTSRRAAPPPDRGSSRCRSPTARRHLRVGARTATAGIGKGGKGGVGGKRGGERLGETLGGWGEAWG